MHVGGWVMIDFDGAMHSHSHACTNINADWHTCKHTYTRAPIPDQSAPVLHLNYVFMGDVQADVRFPHEFLEDV